MNLLRLASFRMFETLNPLKGTSVFEGSHLNVYNYFKFRS